MQNSEISVGIGRGYEGNFYNEFVDAELLKSRSASLLEGDLSKRSVYIITPIHVTVLVYSVGHVFAMRVARFQLVYVSR